MNHTFKFTLAGALCAFPAIAQACSCAPPPAPKIALESSAAVFVGRVTAVERSDRSSKYQFSVSKQWKGIDGNTASVVTASDGAMCGINFDQNRDYLVYAYTNQGEQQLRTNLCSRTKRAADADADLAELGAPIAGAPATTAAAFTPPGRDASRYTMQLNAKPTQDPLKVLAAALQTSKNSRLFRVNWKSPANLSFNGTALYNRNDSTLKAYSRADTGSQISVSSVLYSGVTDEILQKLAATGKVEQFFLTYAKYGVTKKDVGSKTVRVAG